MAYESIDFDALAGQRPVVALGTDLRIVWVSDAYRRATLLWDRRVIGQYLFDAFPDDPRVPAPAGVRNLHASLRKALSHARPDHMPIQRYDVRAFGGGGGGGGGGGEPAYLLHEVTDVSATVRLAPSG